MKEDIVIPEYCYVGKGEPEINCWFGPANTVTPTHTDPKHNILAQVFGAKSIYLFPPSESKYLYPFNANSLLFNTSQVDIENPSAVESYPNIRKVCGNVA